jgi:hypothetical protein
MVQKRTSWEQVKSGFKIAGSIVLAFSFFIALWSGVRFLTLRNNIENQGTHPLLGGMSILLLCAVLFLTSQIWTKWLLAILVYSAARSLGLLLLLAFESSPRIDLRSALLVIGMFFVSALASVRFARKTPVGAERLGTVFFLVSLVFAIEFQSWRLWLMAIAIVVAGQGVRLLMGRSRGYRKAGSPHALKDQFLNRHSRG